MRTALRFLLPLAILLGLSACEYTEVDGVGTRTADDENPPQHDLDRFDGCSPAPLGQWEADGQLTNNTEVTSTYEVKIAFFADDVRVAERSDWVTDLRPGESAAIHGSWWIDSEDVTNCEVLVINRWG